MADTVTIDAETLSSLTKQAFIRAGFPENDAETSAEILITTELMGISTHGVSRLEQYIKRIRAGVVKADPKISVTSQAPAIAIIDGDDGTYRRVDVHEFRELGGAHLHRVGRVVDQQRHARRVLEEHLLLPLATLAHKVPAGQNGGRARK